MFKFIFFLLFSVVLTSSAYAQSSFKIYMERCQNLRPQIESILVEEGLPTYFFYLALAESGCKVDNESKYHAKGLYQLLPRTFIAYSKGVCFTDKPCPLEKINDPLVSTRVAARYLKSLYDRYDKNLDWVVAAYNAGGTNLKRKTSYVKGKDFAIVRKYYPQAYNLSMKVRSFSQMDGYQEEKPSKS